MNFFSFKQKNNTKEYKENTFPKVFFSNPQGFTLIELLVVIAIIAVLATLAVVALQNSRASARDAKRLADVKQMQTALELYFNDNGSYPTSLTSTIATSGIVYMTTIPTPPTPVDGDCTTENNNYTYSSDGSTYSITFCLGKQTAGLSSGAKVLTRDGVSNSSSGGGSESFACGDTFTDPRDSQQYPTVQIGTQCWMAKNMNYDDGCSSNTWINNTDNRWCGCYENNSSNCATYGKLYQWSAAMAGSTTEGAQGICPEGWHVPTSAEYITLYNTINNNASYLCDGVSSRIGKAMASSNGWITDSTICAVGNNQQTNNSSGFNGLPAGYRDYTSGTFSYVGCGADFWSSSFSSPNALYRYLSCNGTIFGSRSISPVYGFSVRCLKN